MDTIVKSYLQTFVVSEATQTFLSKAQKMFIGGAWLEASDGQTCEVIEPSTEGLITRIPMGTTEDLDRAVQAARTQFDGGAWSQAKPAQRERLIQRLADLIEDNAAELAEIESIDMGKSVAFARAVDIQGTIDTLRYFAGWRPSSTGVPSSRRCRAITWPIPARKRWAWSGPSCRGTSPCRPWPGSLARPWPPVVRWW